MRVHGFDMKGRCTAGVSVAILAAALLTGCGGGGNSPDDTGSATAGESTSTHPGSPSSSGSDTGSSGTSTTPAPSGSASPLPNDWRPQEPTVLATGQKVPDDYEPATLDHPAKNAPKPVMPDEAKQETEAGAQAFLNYYADAQWYSIQTGDTSLVRPISSVDCQKCTEQYDAYDQIYREGNWAAGGFETGTIIPGSFTKRPDGGYNLPISVKSAGILGIEQGKIVERQAPFDEPDSFDAYLYRENGEWRYLTASPRGEM